MKQNKEKSTTAKDVAVVGWFTLSIALLVSTVDAPIWFILLALANVTVSAYFVKDTGFADDTEEASAPSQTNQEGQE